MFKRYIFKAGKRHVTVVASSLEKAQEKARTTLDERLAREGIEPPVAWDLELVSAS